MVNPNDTIKAYIQEERGISFKKQRILSKDGEDLSDVQKHEDSSLILRYAPVIAELSVRMLLMSFIVKDPWLLSRTIEIVIHDDTYKDVITYHSVSKSKVYITAAVKAYIQEKSGLNFNKQKLLLNESASVLKDNAQTLSSLGIRKSFAFILRYVFPVYKVVGLKPGDKVFKLRVKPANTVGDVKAGIQ
ncbi:hypothetical protein R3W88_030440 [Solanum pinnatisectum]|uniref:Ubiquitin-like domain-containing protein n=1 Tax=Solanum pinnatisectum TaxID=50273 RepID=A0AAV9KA08_9SOLN|nr:hypothetical protein R3W88_030440 [Solanum pinnatisectum]